MKRVESDQTEVLCVFKDFLPYLSCEPEVTEYEIKPEDEFIIMSSDGLYEQLQESEVVGWVGKFLEVNKDRPLNLEKAAEFVIENQLQVLADLMGQTVKYVKAMPNKKKSFDDTTVVIIFLNQPKKPEPKKEEPKKEKPKPEAEEGEEGAEGAELAEGEAPVETETTTSEEPKDETEELPVEDLKVSDEPQAD